MARLFFATLLTFSTFVFAGCFNGVCAGGDCTCVEGDSCDFECPEGNCSQQCNEGSECTATCEGGGCSQQCLGDCTFSCEGGDCTQQCGTAMSCSITCEGDGCTSDAGLNSLTGIPGL